MTANEMTDNEIIKEFEKEIKYVKDNEIIKFIEHAINSAKGEDGFKEIYWEKLEYILNFINLQKTIIEKSEKAQTEIEKLTLEIEEANEADRKSAIQALKESKENAKLFCEAINYIKSKAIKEFVEKFAKALSEFDMSSVGLPDYDRGYKDCMTAIEDTIDSLVKMTEEEE